MTSTIVERPPDAASRLEHSHFRAVQQTTARTCLDWGSFHHLSHDDPPFQGVTTVVDDAGDTVSIVDAAGTDSTAEVALARLGWRRTGHWELDIAGRRCAPVVRDRSWAAENLDPLDYPGRSLELLPVLRSDVASRSRIRMM